MAYDPLGVLAVIGLLLFFTIIILNGLEEGRKRQERLNELINQLNAIPLSNSSRNGFTLRIPEKSPYNLVLHKANCSHAKKPDEYNMSSTWKGYFSGYEDAFKFSELIAAIYSGRQYHFHTCSFCRPQQRRNISPPIREDAPVKNEYDIIIDNFIREGYLRMKVKAGDDLEGMKYHLDFTIKKRELPIDTLIKNHVLFLIEKSV